MLYAALVGVLVLLLRDDRLGRLLLGTTTAAVLGVGLFVVGPDLFFVRRLSNRSAT